VKPFAPISSALFTRAGVFVLDFLTRKQHVFPSFIHTTRETDFLSTRKIRARERRWRGVALFGQRSGEHVPPLHALRNRASHEVAWRGAIIPRTFHAAIILAIARWCVDLYYRLIAAAAVALGWGGPADWRPMFGPWADAWTVRKHVGGSGRRRDCMMC
jgi:hypothetical protein